MSQIKNSAESMDALRASLVSDIGSLDEKKIDATTVVASVKEVWDDPIFAAFNDLFEKHVKVINNLCEDMMAYDPKLAALQEALENYENQELIGDFLGF